MRLYEIGTNLLKLEEILEEQDGEMPDEDLDAYLALKDKEEEKIDDLCRWLATLNAEAEHAKGQIAALERLIAAESKRWDDVITTKKKLAARIEQRLKVHFQTVRNGKVHEGAFTVKLAKIGGLRRMVYPVQWDTEPQAAPEHFHRRLIELDKQALRAAIIERDAALDRATTPDEVIAIDTKYRHIASATLAEQGVRLVVK